MLSTEGSLTFGQWLRTWRTAKGLSIKGAAEIAGWRPQFWSNLEQETRTRKGGLPPKPDEHTVEVIAKVLNIPLNIVMLAAGHAPSDLQALMCSFVPKKMEGTYIVPDDFPDMIITNSGDDISVWDLDKEMASMGEQKKPFTIWHFSDINSRETDTGLEEVVQRLDQVEDNVDKIAHFLEELGEIKTLAESIRHKKLETRNVM